MSHSCMAGCFNLPLNAKEELIIRINLPLRIRMKRGKREAFVQLSLLKLRMHHGIMIVGLPDYSM
jgi:hypothetical protein